VATGASDGKCTAPN